MILLRDKFSTPVRGVSSVLRIAATHRYRLITSKEYDYDDAYFCM
jgi:hypothetical protein